MTNERRSVIFHNGKYVIFLDHTNLSGSEYVNAVKAAGGDESQVQKSRYRYPGPRPQSLESAVLMLADGSEARVRAERPMDTDHLRRLIKGVIDNYKGDYNPHYFTGLGSALWVIDRYWNHIPIVTNALHQYIDFYFQATRG